MGLLKQTGNFINHITLRMLGGEPKRSSHDNAEVMKLNEGNSMENPFSKEELEYIEREMNASVSYCSGMLVKGDSLELSKELSLAESIREKVRKM